MVMAMWFGGSDFVSSQILFDPGLGKSPIAVGQGSLVQEKAVEKPNFDNLGEGIVITIDEPVNPDELLSSMALVKEEKSLFRSRSQGEADGSPNEFIQSHSPGSGDGFSFLYLVVSVGFLLVCIVGVIVWIVEHGNGSAGASDRRTRSGGRTDAAPY